MAANLQPLKLLADQVRYHQGQEQICLSLLRLRCREIKERAGVSDREIAVRTGLSRARIQQLRTENG